MLLKRRAFTLIEATTAAALLATLMGITVIAFQRIAEQQIEIERSWAANQEANNWLERLTALSWSELNNDTFQSARPSEWASNRLIDPTLRIEITEQKLDRLKRITVELRWKSSAGQRQGSVRLSTWVANRRPDQ